MINRCLLFVFPLLFLLLMVVVVLLLVVASNCFSSFRCCLFCVCVPHCLCVQIFPQNSRRKNCSLIYTVYYAHHRLFHRPNFRCFHSAFDTFQKCFLSEIVRKDSSSFSPPSSYFSSTFYCFSLRFFARRITLL